MHPSPSVKKIHTLSATTILNNGFGFKLFDVAQLGVGKMNQIFPSTCEQTWRHFNLPLLALIIRSTKQAHTFLIQINTLFINCINLFKSCMDSNWYLRIIFLPQLYFSQQLHCVAGSSLECNPTEKGIHPKIKQK